ncbi:AAA family ATPase [Candidatus Bathyarchaeota archaeon]|nr:AAA family ATPase [Candidatus Bathyarchaeota archaeon]
MEINRLKTGIPKASEDLQSFDELLSGGIPENNIVLVTGPAGSGKSIFSLQFLVNGAEEFNEKGIYISFEQSREDIIQQAQAFNWDIKRLEEEGKIKVLTHSVTADQPSRMLKDLEDKIREYQPKRVVVDSISTFAVYMEIIGFIELVMDYSLEEKKHVKISSEMATRKTIMNLIETLKACKVTALLISERSEESGFLSRDTVSEFLADGIISLNFIGVAGDQFGDIQVRKMRHTNHAHQPFLTHISENGMSIGEETVEGMH